jgi:uncharacterized protein
MDRIEGFGGLFNVPNRSSGKPKPRKSEKKLPAFFTFLEHKDAAESAEGIESARLISAEDLERLLDTVHEAGEKLKTELSLASIQEYKTAVRSFLKKVVSASFALEERTSGSSIAKRKKFTLVKVVDEKLERLAAEVLVGQKDQIEILRRLDEIHGLLIDLLQ